MPRKTQIQVRRDTASNWTTVNPVLASGEIGFETNTNKMKIGDGTTVWSSLAYQGGSAAALPTGGTTGQILSKNSSTNYDAVWSDNVSAVQHLQTYVKNDEATTITKGTAVYTSGSNGTNVLVKRALATSDATSARTLGLAETDIPANGGGYIITDGVLSGLNTSAGNDGDIVYLSGSTAGGLIYGYANKPHAPVHLVYLGVLTKKSAGNGEILVKVQNGFELDELHNVDTGFSNALANNDVLSYESSTSLWKNKTLSGAGIAAASHTHGNISNAGALSTSVTATNPVKVVITDSGNTVGTLITSGASSTTFLRGDGTWATPTVGSISQFFYTANATTTLANNTSAQSPFGLTTGVSLVSGTVYDVEVYIQGTCGSTSGQLQFLGALGSGTQTLYSSGFRTTSVPAALEGRAHTSTATLGAATSASTGTVFYLTVRGKVVATANTTWNPQIGFSVASGTAPTTSAGSYVRVTPVAASATPLNIGSWS